MRILPTKSFARIMLLRSELLSFKEHNLLVNPNAFKGNTAIRQRYCAMLNQLIKVLSPYQLYAIIGLLSVYYRFIIGLLLSDATLQFSSSSKKFRVKMQQSRNVTGHEEFINHIIQDVLPEWTIQTVAQPGSANRPNMLEFQTITHEAFALLASIISYPPFDPYKGVPKMFSIQIIRWLHPIAIAYGFMVGKQVIVKIILIKALSFTLKVLIMSQILLYHKL